MTVLVTLWGPISIYRRLLKATIIVFHQILTIYGIPYGFYTDKRTVVEYKRKGSTKLENDTFTQFGYAYKQLGVDLKTTSVPKAKGRVERIFGTLKSRLPIKLRLAGVNTLEQANEFLTSYVKKFNAKFALPINHTKSVFEKQPCPEKINLILAIITRRIVDNGHCIKFNNKYFKPVEEYGRPAYHRKGTPCLVIQAFDGNLFTTINDSVFSLEKVPKYEPISKNFDLPEPLKKTPKTIYSSHESSLEIRRVLKTHWLSTTPGTS